MCGIAENREREAEKEGIFGLRLVARVRSDRILELQTLRASVVFCSILPTQENVLGNFILCCRHARRAESA